MLKCLSLEQMFKTECALSTPFSLLKQPLVSGRVHSPLSPSRPLWAGKDNT